MAADQNCRAHRFVLRHLRGRGSSQQSIVSGVQALHHLQIQRAHLQTLRQPHHQGIFLGFGAAVLRQIGTHAINLLEDLFPLAVGVRRVARLEVFGVIEIGTGAFQTIGQHLQDAEDVLVPHQRRARQEAAGRGQLQERLCRGLGLFRRGAVAGSLAGWQLGDGGIGHRPLKASVFQMVLHLPDQLIALIDVLHEARVIEVHVRQG
mmetsp:Transcript_9480/g.16269  ORF Transcript_9480/g.16269 Transcript_9480/m.16269 type:complete len:206 (+) Transcript_9480:1117-1734(+)